MGNAPDTLSYEQIMRLDEAQIERLFPHGALDRKDRWVPAPPDSRSARSLKALIRDRRKRLEPLRYLHANSIHGYTETPEFALGAQTARTRADSGRRVEPEPPAVPADIVETYSKEARAKDEERQAQIPLSQRLAALEGVLHPAQYASLRTRIERLERLTNRKAA